MNINLRFGVSVDAPQIPSLPIEARGRLVWVLHDQFSAHWNYTTRYISGNNAGTPATCKCADSGYSEMDEAFQIYWRDWIGQLAPGRSMEENNKEFNDVTHGAKYATNGYGTEEDSSGYHNYIMGWHADKADPRKEDIVCTGNPLISIPGKTKNFSGQVAQAVLCLDMACPMPPIKEFMKFPLWVCFIGYSTIITRLPSESPIFPSTVTGLPSDWKGNRQVDPFPNNADYPTQMTPLPFASFIGEQTTFNLSNKYGEFMELHCRVKYIRNNRLVALPDNEFPISPFVR